MKKLFSSLCVFAILCLLAFSGCSDGWTEVQSVTYYTDSVAHTYTSKIYYDGTVQDIDQSEYENAPSEKKYRTNSYMFRPSYTPTLVTMKSDRKTSISEIEEKVNTSSVYYQIVTDMNESGDVLQAYYKKCYIDTYELRYVKIKFTEKNFIEVNYYNGAENETIKALFTSYEVTYFKN